MLPQSPSDSPQTGFFNVLDQLDPSDALLALGQAIPWSVLEEEFAPLYSHNGRRAKPIRLMCGLLMLKQLHNLSDEAVVQAWKQNPYYQVFCGELSFQRDVPCHSTELVKFRERLGKEGIEKLFALSVALHGQAAEASTVLVDTTVQEKAITYPTDSKLSIETLAQEEQRFALYESVLSQQPKDKNKIYSLHEPDVYCVGKGKDHKPYE